MKASAKIRQERRATPLFRAKVPVAVLGFPFVAAASTGGDPGDLSFQLRTAFSGGPSLRFTFLPDPPPAKTPFSITLSSGVGLWGSPEQSPLIVSAHLPLSSSAAAPAALSFSIQIRPSLGDFSLKRSAGGPLSAAAQNPNPFPKENGGGLYRPMPVETDGHRRPVAAVAAAEWDLIAGTTVAVRTTLPVARGAAVRLRWAVSLPAAAEGGFTFSGLRLPSLAVDKISVESSVNGEGQPAAAAAAAEEKGIPLWMKTDLEILRREHGLIREGLEELRRTAQAAAGGRRSRSIASAKEFSTA
ncbi:unnamed protein product [Spirodela intermedia]|uniref:Uncharacterized protein n=1 Tax=Spirodela intermedia TaxID=51605 RepID=A0A7I8LA71_SPIIN|nr:unnamed protein product [Spirodela intermedia]